MASFLQCYLLWLTQLFRKNKLALPLILLSVVATIKWAYWWYKKWSTGNLQKMIHSFTLFFYIKGNFLGSPWKVHYSWILAYWSILCCNYNKYLKKISTLEKCSQVNKIYLDLVLHSSGFMCNKNAGNMFWVHSSTSLHAMISWDAETNHFLQLNSSQSRCGSFSKGDFMPLCPTPSSESLDSFRANKNSLNSRQH